MKQIRFKQKWSGFSVSVETKPTQSSLLNLWRVKEEELLLVCYELCCVRLEPLSIDFEYLIVPRIGHIHCSIRVNLMDDEWTGPS